MQLFRIYFKMNIPSNSIMKFCTSKNLLKWSFGKNGQSNCRYHFARSTLMNGKTPITVCSICKQEGHSKKKCPDEVAMEMEPLPELTPELKQMLDFSVRVCFGEFQLIGGQVWGIHLGFSVTRSMETTNVHTIQKSLTIIESVMTISFSDMFSLRKEEIRDRDGVCEEILKLLREVYDPNVCLQLFGSSRNRFTFQGSDLDICLTLNGNATGEVSLFLKSAPPTHSWCSSTSSNG